MNIEARIARHQERTPRRADVKLPPKLIPIFEGTARIRGAFGGRGSAKSRSFAKMAAVRAYMWAKAGRSGIILCGRQFMNSLDESSMAEVKAAIRSEPWLDAFFRIGEKYIRTKDSRVAFKFVGLDSNVGSVKSKSHILLCWVDEAEEITEEAWQTLIPTIREAGSELWVTWNPKSKRSATHKRFREQMNPERMKIVELNWRDNPWFPPELEDERRDDLNLRPDIYDHVWGGDFGTVTQGAVLAKLVSKSRRDGRINTSVDYDPDGPGIEISSDLGFRDTACWWFWQRRAGGFALLDYMGDSGLDADAWIGQLQERLTERGWPLKKIWLPHDARSKTFASRHSPMERFLASFGEAKVAVVPMTSIPERINAARTIIKRCEFNSERCSDGIDGLEAWEFEWNKDNQAFSRNPLHNYASHPSDAFSYGCQVMTEPKQPEKPDVVGLDPIGKPIYKQPTPKPLGQMTYNEFIASRPKRTGGRV